MKTTFKKKLLAYLQEHNDGSETAEFLIRTMEFETHYADVDCFGVSVDDLDGYHDRKGLRALLGKDDTAPYTDDDCQRVADLIDDAIAEEFSDALDNVIANRR